MPTSRSGRPRPRLGKAWRETRELIAERRGRLGLGLVVVLIGRASGLVLPGIIGFVVDEVIGNGRTGLLAWLLLAAALGTILQAATSFGLANLLSVTAQQAVTDLRRRVERHVVRLEVSFFDSRQSGELISRIMSDATGISNLIGSGLVYLAGSLTTAVLAFGVLLWLNWKLTLLVIALVVLFATAMMASIGRLRPIYRRVREIDAEVTGRLTEILGGIRVVKAYTAEPREDRLFAEGTGRLLRANRRAILASATIGAFATASFGLLSVGLLGFGARSIIDGAMTLGDFVMYVAFTGFLIAPAAQVAGLASQLSEAFAGLDRIRELEALGSEDDEDRNREPVPSVRGDIELEAVSFSYREGLPVLYDVSLVIPHGTTTALVGPSGAGKSTLFRLAIAFDNPDSGRVLVDGRDLASLRRRDYRSHVGVVLQEGFLFDGTIAENILYSRPEASREEIEEAGALAHCDQFVDALDDGYDTVTGERGIRLSGGQRQRVAIARAILADPRILLLDEATSSLDSESEALIQDGLRTLREGRTTLVIAHRLSTVRTVDQIVVLDEGRVVETGTHDELLGREGRYAELWRLQSGAWEKVDEILAPVVGRETG